MKSKNKNCNEFFGDNLKRLRTNRGMTQADIGKLVNKCESAVRMWELRNSEPDYETVSKLADFFGVTVDYLLGRDVRQHELSDQERRIIEKIKTMTEREAMEISNYMDYVIAKREK